MIPSRQLLFGFSITSLPKPNARMTYMKRIFAQLILTISIISIALPSHASEFKNWILAYHHDSTGSPISGSLNALISAIQNGSDVRVGFGNYNGKPTSFREEGTLIINTAPASGTEVILSTSTPSLNTNGSGNMTLVSGRYAYEIFSTSGTRLVDTYFITTGATDGPRLTQTWEMFWYISK